MSLTNWVAKQVDTATGQDWRARALRSAAIIQPEAFRKHERIRPIIGISAAKGDSKSLAAMMSLVRAQGGTPIFIGNHAERIRLGVENGVEFDLAKLDAVVVLGNDLDIDPRKYGQAIHSDTKIETDLARAAYEETLLAKALERKIPVLAICGGMQRLNVLGGGTLHQHIPDIVGNDNHNQRDLPPFIPVQFVNLLPGTQLQAVAEHSEEGVYVPSPLKLPNDVSVENSMHHQAVAIVRPGFRAAALSNEGLIEAIEPDPNGPYAGQYIIGVQWHPEFAPSQLSANIVKDVVEHAKSFATHKQRRPHVPESAAYRESLLSSMPGLGAKSLPQSLAAYVENRRSQLVDTAYAR